MANDKGQGVELLPTSDPPSLADLTEDEQVEAMTEWFHENFEDPAQETPHDSGEGGYIYIWGGPYDASEQLQDAFSDQVSFEVIERATEEVQDRDGISNWAPNGHRIGVLDAEDDAVESGDIVDGDSDEWPPLVAVPNPQPDKQAQALNILTRLDDLERSLKDLQLPAAPIGHNNPPEPIDFPPLTEQVRQEIQKVIVEIRVELKSPEPNATKIEEGANFFQKISSKLLQWIGVGVSGAITAGIGGAVSHYPEIIHHLESVYQAIISWF